MYKRVVRNLDLANSLAQQIAHVAPRLVTARDDPKGLAPIVYIAEKVQPHIQGLLDTSTLGPAQRKHVQALLQPTVERLVQRGDRDALDRAVQAARPV